MERQGASNQQNRIKQIVPTIFTWPLSSSASGVAVAKTHDPAKTLDPATSARSSFFLDSIDSTRKKRKREKKLQSQSGAQKEPQHQPRASIKQTLKTRPNHAGHRSKGRRRGGLHRTPPHRLVVGASPCPLGLCVRSSSATGTRDDQRDPRPPNHRCSCCGGPGESIPGNWIRHRLQFKQQ